MQQVQIGRPTRRSARRLMRTAVAATAVSCLALALDAAPSPQAPPASQTPTFRARTDLVTLDVSVLDDDRKPIKGLTAGDFTLTIDGTPRPITSFASVELPSWPGATASWVRDVGPDVVSNRRDARRAVVIVLDDLGTARDPSATKLARAVAHSVVDELGPADLAAVVYTITRRQGQEFTMDRMKLRASIDRFIPSGLTSPPLNRLTAEAPSGGLQTMPNLGGQPGACPRPGCVVLALQNAASILEAWPGGKKTVILVSPGKQPPSDPTGQWDENDALGQMRIALQRANVNVYQFDPRGLETQKSVNDDFGVFAENTGGRAFTNTNDPQMLVPQVFQENSSYYLLGFSPNDDREGRFHRVSIKVNRPGTHVRTRSGYYRTSDEPTPTRKPPVSAVDRALSGGLPTGDLPISIVVSPFPASEKPGAALAIAARLEHDANAPVGPLMELTAAAFNDEWKEVGRVTQRFELPEVAARGSASEVAVRLNVPPGKRYEVRAAVRDVTTERAGSVYASVSVPHFEKDALSLSGPLLSATTDLGSVSADLGAVLPARLSTLRTFARDQRVSAHVRLNQPRSKPAVAARIVAHVIDDRDRVVSTMETTIGTATFGATRQADYRFDVPVGQLTPGEYLLRTDATAGKASSRRDVRFSVLAPVALNQPLP